MVTRSDVARHAGTSTAVVSYVINNGPRPVAEETRGRVLQAIAELGYRPNRLAQALRGHRSKVLGLIVPDISNPFYAELARAIENATDRMGYTLVLGNSEQAADRELRYIRTFLDRKVDGMFMISGSTSEQLKTFASEIDIPFIIIDRRLNYMQNAFLFTTDNRAGAALAVKHLIDLGHTDIAALCGPSQLGSERANGYKAAMELAGLPARIHHSDQFDRQSSYTTAMRVLASLDRPSAIFAANDLAGISVLRAAADLGVVVPDDVAVVAYDDIAEGQYTVPRLTTVAQPTEELGSAAAVHLIDLVERRIENEFGIKLIQPRLVVRESCGTRTPLGQCP